jgi:hypothetical protein
MTAASRHVLAFVMVLVLVAVPIVSWTYMVASGRLVDSANVLSGVLAPVALIGGGFASVWSWWHRGADSGPDAVRLDAAMETLAGQLLVGWRREAAARGITTPFTLDLAWRWADDGDYASVEDVSSDPPAGAGPSRIPGIIPGARLPATGTVAELHGFYRQLGHGRLVILGGKGSGKSGALVLLNLAVLDHRSGLAESDRGEVPVPVLLSMTGWDPGVESVAQWLTSVLTRDHPFLKSSRFGRDAAGELFRSGRLALFLDGFDEMPERLRPRALARLAEEPGVRMVIAGRTQEFAAADGESHLPYAAVVELLPVGAPAAAEYLLHGQTSSRQQMWRRFTDRLLTAPGSPAARALSTPLALSLARKSYSAGADPQELLVESRFPTADQILGHLIGTVLVVAYPDEVQREQAARLLSWLARTMNAHYTRDLAWWRMRYWNTPLLQPVVACVVFGLTGGMATGIAGGTAFGAAFGAGWLVMGCVLSVLTLRVGMRRGQAVGGPVPRLIVAIMLGFGFGAGIALVHELAAGQRYGVLAAWTFGVLFGVAMGLAVGLVVLHDGPLVGRARLPYSREIAPGLAVGGISGIGVWVVTGGASGAVVAVIAAMGMTVASSLTRPSDTSQAGPSAAESYADDLRGSLLFGAVSGTFTGLGFWIGAAHLGWGKSLVLGASCAVLSGLGGVLVTSQAVAFRLGTAGLTLRRVASARPMKQLMEAYDRQVLRQVGTIYQFRHAELQEYLGRR